MNSFLPSLPFSAGSPWLAPLAGYTDLPFRLLCREYGAAVACTEMVSAKGLVYGQGKKTGGTEALLATLPEPIALCAADSANEAAGEKPCQETLQTDGEPGTEQAAASSSGITDRPLVVQVFGAEADFLAEAVRRLRDRGYRYFDLNMGCSVPKVVKSGSGAAMLRDPRDAVLAVRAMVDAAPGRVGCKIRLGWQRDQEVYLELARRLEDIGIAWITLHPRYAKQAFTGDADWGALAKLKRTVQIPVIASGDLFSAEDAVRCVATTGVDTVMFARGAMQDPAVFQKYRARLAGDPVPDFTRAALQRMILRHIELVRRYGTGARNREGIPAGLLQMRSFIPRYCKHLPGCRHLRAAMVGVRTWEELTDLLQGFFTAPQEDA